MAPQIIHWNCRGLIKNLDDIHEILTQHQPNILCLQETHLNPTHTNFLKNYVVYRKDRQGSAHSSGGVAIVAQHSIPSQPLSLVTDLEAVAIRALTFGRVITICSIYIPPDHQLSTVEFEMLIDQLPDPFLLVGDFNAHHPLWGCTRTDSRGALIENFLLSSGSCIFNKKEPTYFNIARNTYTAIDLAIGSPLLLAATEWSVIDNLYGSDHFPISLKYIENISSQSVNTSRKFREQAADWLMFRDLSALSCSSILGLDIDKCQSLITLHIIDAAEKSIPQTSGKSQNKQRPWWNAECKNARKNQNKAWSKFRRYPTSDNLINFKQAKANGRRIRRESKRESWHSFLSSINSYTDTHKVYGRLRVLQGRSAHPVPLISTAGDTLEHQADAIGQHFEHIFSSTHYTDSFMRHKLAEERKPLRDKRPSTGGYNSPLTMEELKAALRTCGNSAPGPDRITYGMLKHLHENTLETVLYLFNKIWASGRIPKAWKEAVIIPILKQGKEASLASSYRPIALTSCLCKVFEKIVNRRLVYFLEYNGLLDKHQAGFRSGRSTTDQLVAFESYVRDAFIHKQHCLSVFFDLEKAYDTAWRYGILRDLHSFGVSGSMLNTIESYLSERTFVVRVGNALSKHFIQENGVPQGGVLSCTLFIVKMNSLRSVLPKTISYSVYVDDVQISFKSCNLAICERQIQLGVNKLSGWAEKNGFKFNCGKTVSVLFSKQRGIRPDPDIIMNGQAIASKKEHKFLGVIVDEKATFVPHIKQLRLKCLKALNLLKVLSHQSWGTDRDCLLNLLNSIILSRIDYCSVVYESASRSALKMLDPVYHLGLRLATGAFRTSPIASLYVEADRWSLERRRQYTSVLYATKVLSLSEHPSGELLRDTTNTQLFSRRPAATPPYPIRVSPHLQSLCIPVSNIEVTSHKDTIAPWETHAVNCDISFIEVGKHGLPLAINQHFLYLQAKYRCAEYYTDASKSSVVACAAHGPEFSASLRMNEHTSIFTAECWGILLAVKHILKKKHPNSVIYTDSLSAVTALSSSKRQRNPVMNSLLKCLMSAHTCKLIITLCWVPGHCNIAGNEVADRLAAAAALRSSLDVDTVPYQDLRPHIRNTIRGQWQEEWNTAIENKLHIVKPNIGRFITEKGDRFKEVTLCRLRIGHTHATHSHLLNNSPPPKCPKCGDILTVMHVLIECESIEGERRHHFPELCTHQIPLHPSFFLGDCPMFSITRVFTFLTSVGFLRLVSYLH